jgi:hypothetical protein
MGKVRPFRGSPAARYPENRMSTGQKGPEREGLRKGGGGLGRVLPAQITSDRAGGHVPDQETWTLDDT